MEINSKRAFVVPVGIFFTPGGKNAAGKPVVCALLAQVDHTLPAFAGAVKAIGGERELGETPKQAALREMEEEVPGWLEKARIPNSRKGFMGLDTGGDKDGLFCAHQDENFALYLVFADVGPVSFLLFKSNSRESSPIGVTLDWILRSRESDWAFPLMRTVLLKQMQIISNAVQASGT